MIFRKKPRLNDLLLEIEQNEMWNKEGIIKKFEETKNLSFYDLLRLFLVTWQTLELEKKLSSKLQSDLDESERTLNFLRKKNES